MTPICAAHTLGLLQSDFSPDYLPMRKLISSLLCITLYDLQPSQKYYLGGKYKTKTLSPDWVTARNWIHKRWKTTLDIELCCDFLNLSYDRLLDLAKDVESGKIEIPYKRTRIDNDRT